MPAHATGYVANTMRYLGALLLALLLAAPATARDRAPGAPGLKASWTKADKHGFGTSHTRASRIWFTLRSAELSEVYYPDLSTPAIRDLELVIDGERETRAGSGSVERLDGLNYRQTVTDRFRRWRVTKTYTTDPQRPTVMVDVRFESLTGEPYDVHVLLDPQLDNDGSDDRARTAGRFLVAYDGKAASALTAAPAFTATSSGYAGRSDGWRDLRRDGTLDWRYHAKRRGNVRQSATTALDGVGAQELTLALGLGRNAARARRNASRSLGTGFAALAASNADSWRAYRATLKPAPAAAAPVADAYETSVLLLAAHEDKRFRGASVASPSMPWGWGLLSIDPSNPRSGPYHLVWPRDLYQVATAHIAAGDEEAAERNLDFLLDRAQKRDGHFPNNTHVDGTEEWTTVQMDQQGFPIVLAWQLGRFDRPTWRKLRRTADFIVREGPRTDAERWENQDGFSPASIAAEIAGLVCAADIARRNGADRRAARYERVADRWARNVERWTATTTGPHSDAPYYVRITKDRRPDRGTRYAIGDSGPSKADQRRVVDPSFLELVRLGVKPPDDPVVLNTLAVVDEQLKVDTPNGAFWHRFTFDGYGERRDGGPWELFPDDTRRTLGRVWPIFAGERGEYELLAGRPATAHLAAMAAAGNDGGMIPEQVWDGRLPTGTPGHELGEGTFSATPLAWSHAQLVRLAWSIDAGAPVEQPAIVACRYARRCG